MEAGPLLSYATLYAGLASFGSRKSDALAKYPELKDEIKLLADADPTGRQTYLAWGADQVSKGESPREVTDALSRFHAAQPRMDKNKRDINAFRSVRQLLSAVRRAEGKITRKDIEEGKQQGAELILSEPDYNVYRVFSPTASVCYGKDTRWCIAAMKENQFRHYHEELGSDVFVLVGPDPRDKVAVIVGRQDGKVEVRSSTNQKQPDGVLPTAAVNAIEKASPGALFGDPAYDHEDTWPQTTLRTKKEDPEEEELGQFLELVHGGGAQRQMQAEQDAERKRKKEKAAQFVATHGKEKAVAFVLENPGDEIEHELRYLLPQHWEKGDVDLFRPLVDTTRYFATNAILTAEPEGRQEALTEASRQPDFRDEFLANLGLTLGPGEEEQFDLDLDEEIRVLAYAVRRNAPGLSALAKKLIPSVSTGLLIRKLASELESGWGKIDPAGIRVAGRLLEAPAAAFLRNSQEYRARETVATWLAQTKDDLSPATMDAVERAASQIPRLYKLFPELAAKRVAREQYDEDPDAPFPDWAKHIDAELLPPHLREARLLQDWWEGDTVKLLMDNPEVEWTSPDIGKALFNQWEKTVTRLQEEYFAGNDVEPVLRELLEVAPKLRGSQLGALFNAIHLPERWRDAFLEDVSPQQREEARSHIGQSTPDLVGMVPPAPESEAGPDLDDLLER